MSGIKEIPFKEFDFKALNNQHLSLGWDMGNYYILVWKDKVGNSNNDILFKSILPKFLSNAIADYILGNFTSTRTFADL